MERHPRWPPRLEAVAAHLAVAAGAGKTALKPTWGPAPPVLGDGAAPPAAVPYDEALPGCDRAGLSAEEAAAFVERGFLVKRGLASRAEMARVSDYVWRNVERTGVLRRAEPRTWLDALEPPGVARPGHIAPYASWWTDAMSEARAQQIGGSGGSLEPAGPRLEPPGPLLTHFHTIY
jgi:hypothetical protein